MIFGKKEYFWIIGDKKLRAPSYDSEEDASRVAATRFEDFRVEKVDTKDFEKARQEIKKRMKKETGGSDKGMVDLLNEKIFGKKQDNSSPPPSDQGGDLS